MADLIHPDEALKLVLEGAKPLPVESRPLEETAGYYLYDDIAAACDLPPFDNSAMDGYALRECDGKGAGQNSPVSLSITQTISAGTVPTSLTSGSAAKIMTGAPMPEGADTVLPREYTRENEGSVDLLEAPEVGDHVRCKGDDMRAGDPLMPAGRRLRPYEIGLLAAQGLADIRVHARARAAILSSGDELVPFTDRLSPGRIRNSSGPALASLVSSWDCVPVACGITTDREDAIKEAITRALTHADSLLLCGGVSVGDFDFTRSALDSLGFEERFWRTAIRPGKPLLFGLLNGKPVFGLPGNPMSTLVTAEVFVRPALERMSGSRGGEDPFGEIGTLEAPFRKPRALRHFLFCSAKTDDNGKTSIKVLEPQGSALLGMGARANALAVGPEGVADLEPGMEMRFKWL